ncbi:MAG: dephospho-CoA kinase [Rhodospirillales bacterium]|nr:dephospho-CoA kinase [Rhodospirillales bacterium]MCW9039123.1 dephospho-CoA kinase [Rhodospirillales bacterium]
MIVLGLTGSIGMGKTTTARMFRRLGVPVHDADAEVHRLLGPGGAAVSAVAETFPGVVKGAGVDRGELGRRVFGHADALSKLEAILHPQVRAAEHRFLSAAAARGVRLVVLDIPLLFETGGDARCDFVAVVVAPRRIQESRVLGRAGMTAEKLAGIRSRQMADAQKVALADFIIPTGLGRRPAFRRVAGIVRLLRGSGA